ncbi:MAG: HEAT repeat domain-containing protein, partial [Actinomycetia bacterium]|nr:HEAT repeat domain-containing protein [Actinomycetes bacterium]
GSPTGIGALTGLGPDTAAEVRAEAATALGWIGGDVAIAGLDVALGDSEPIVIRAAAESLRRLGRPGLDRLQALASTDGKAGAFAREALDLTRVRTVEGRAA